MLAAPRAASSRSISATGGATRNGGRGRGSARSSSGAGNSLLVIVDPSVFYQHILVLLPGHVNKTGDYVH